MRILWAVCWLALVGRGALGRHDIINRIIEEVIDEVERLLPDDTCLRHLVVRRNETAGAALQMLDASSKIPTGLLNGHVADLGDYDECLDIGKDRGDGHLKGQYCRVSFPLAPRSRDVFFDLHDEIPKSRGIMNLISADPRLSLAVCIPASCSRAALQLLLNYGSGRVESCQVRDHQQSWEAGDYVVMVIICSIALIVVASTIYDVVLDRHDLGPIHPIFVAFSAYTNGRKLFAMSPVGGGQLPCLNGIRFISMLWVITGHVFYTGFFTPTTNNKAIQEWMKDLSSMVILGATVSVDTFFVLSGLLLAYMYLTSMDKGVRFNVPMYYLHRYLRLTPSLLAAIAVHMTLIRFMGDGPLWPDVSKSLRDNCVKNWWAALLYVQNYVCPHGTCIGQTWYLSVDMQLFVLSPLVLIPLRRYTRVALWALGVLAVLSIISPFVISWVDEIQGLIPLAMGNPNTTSMYYVNTYARFGPWIVGVYLGYLIYNRTENFRLNRAFDNVYFKFGGWAASVVLLLVVVFAGNNMFFHEYDRFESAIFLATHRVVWAVALSWIIYACVTGHGGVINGFLSLPLFQILARLTYSMYLLHLSLQFMKIGRMRAARYFSNTDYMYEFWGDLMITMMLSVLWTLAFESPMIAIEKILFARGLRKKTTADLPGR